MHQSLDRERYYFGRELSACRLVRPRDCRPRPAQMLLSSSPSSSYSALRGCPEEARAGNPDLDCPVLRPAVAALGKFIGRLRVGSGPSGVQRPEWVLSATTGRLPRPLDSRSADVRASGAE